MTDLGWDLEYFSDTAGPPAPVALPATEVTQASFRANWLASAARAERYLLDVARDPAFTDFLFRDRIVAALSEVVTGVTTATNYYYRVRGLNRYAAGGYSNVITVFTDSIEAPVATAATNVQDNGFAANWNPVVDPDLDHYELDVSDDGFATLLPLGAPIQVESDTETFQVTNLAPEVAYEYRVRAVKVNGTASAHSNVIDVTTDPVFVGQGGDLVLYFPATNESVHIFDTVGTDTFEVLQGSSAVRRLIVGGGGQGGGVNGSGVSCGGGGAGGVLDLDEVDRPTELGVDDYPVVVGKGGSTPGALNVGEDGDDSSFAGDTAQGGGHGGSAGANVGSGGSGGGAVNSSGGPESAGSGTAGQGNNGGTGNAGAGGGGGGGGAAEVGENGTVLKGGDGGDGIASDITGDVVLYGAGGGGAIPVGVFGPLPDTIPGAGGAGGGGAGRATAGPGNPGSGIGSGGGGTIGNNAGGAGTKGRVAIRYHGRANDITPPPPDPAEPRGPITFAGCTRRQVVDGVDIDIDCNSKNNTGIFPDYRQYECLGGGVVKSSRLNPAYGSTTGNDGILVFRFSEPIRKFIITRRVTTGTDTVPRLIACDDYTVVEDAYGSPPGSSRDGSIVGWKTISPAIVYYPPPAHFDPPVNLAAEEEMSVEWAAGFSCVVIMQGPEQDPKSTSEFIDPYFLLLTD